MSERPIANLELMLDSASGASQAAHVPTRRAAANTESEMKVDGLSPVMVGDDASRGSKLRPNAGLDPRGTSSTGANAPPAKVAVGRAAGPAAPAEKPSLTDFRARLEGRVLIITGDDAASYASVVSDSQSGLVIGGKKAAGVLRRLAAEQPTRMLAIDPWQSQEDYATVERPFILDVTDDGQQSLFDGPSLEDSLRAQISLGAAFAVTPTGVMRAGDSRPLKAAVLAANKVRRVDVVLYMPLEPAWLTRDNLRSLIGILSKCQHPVAIAIADRNLDPYSKVLPALRQVVAALPYAIVWRTDLAGLDLMAHGAKAACVGVRPSQRAADIPGEKRIALNKIDKHPNVLRPELLRWVKTTLMVENWYASTDPPGCGCCVCGGGKVDRYGDSVAAQLEAHRHNVAVLMQLIEPVPALVGAKAWWKSLVADAIAEHTALGGRIGGQVKVPASLGAFNKD